MKAHYFWFSQQQAEFYANSTTERWQRNLAQINGKWLPYTLAAPTLEHGSKWPDLQYLGHGTIAGSDGYWGDGR